MTQPDRFELQAERYARWLEQQPLSPHTRRAYRGQVTRFLLWLAATPIDGGDPLADPSARDYAARDYKQHLKTVKRAKPASVNLALAAVDSFYRWLGAGSPEVNREDLPPEAPRALSPEEQKKFLRAVERIASDRDRAIAVMLLHTGLRLGELAALSLHDVSVTARKGQVIVRSGKGDKYRTVPLNAQAREALELWLIERRTLDGDPAALFLSRRGQRLTSRAIDLVIRKLAEEAGLTMSAHVLRHTCVTNLVRGGVDLITVATLAGHQRLETTRRYSLPSEADREAAMERLNVEY